MGVTFFEISFGRPPASFSPLHNFSQVLDFLRLLNLSPAGVGLPPLSPLRETRGAWRKNEFPRSLFLRHAPNRVR